jgi:ABC-type multidrug transport system permease subunit
MAGLNDDIEVFFVAMLTLFIVANCAVSFGIFLSSMASSVQVAIGLSAPLLAPLMIFAGSFINVELSIQVFSL